MEQKTCQTLSLFSVPCWGHRCLCKWQLCSRPQGKPGQLLHCFPGILPRKMPAGHFFISTQKRTVPKRWILCTTWPADFACFPAGILIWPVHARGFCLHQFLRCGRLLRNRVLFPGKVSLEPLEEFSLGGHMLEHLSRPHGRGPAEQPVPAHVSCCRG